MGARVWPWAALCWLCACVLAGLVVGSPAIVVLPPAVSAWLLHAGVVTRRRRRAARTDQAAIATVDALIQDLKSGGSLAAALRQHQGVVRAGLAAGSENGRLLDVTLDVLVARGGRALPSLERLSDTLRSAQALRGEVSTQAGQATASATVMAALPVVFVAALALLDERMLAFYLFSPVGAGCLLVSLLLSHLGWWLMQRMIGAER